MSTNRFGIVSFDSIKHLQSEIQRNNWVLARKENAKWTWGKHFTEKDEHLQALNHGRTTPTLLTQYKKIRTLLESKIRVSKFQGKGISCKRKRRYMDDGDEVDIDRFLANSDEPWVTTKRNRKTKNIRIGINFGLSFGNNEASFGRLVGAGAYISDVLTKMGYATEIIGMCYTACPSTPKKYDKTCTMITFKGSNERLDVQRILSMGLTGLLRHEIFKVHHSYFGYMGSMGMQATVTDEHKQELKLDYIVEQAIIKDHTKLQDNFEKALHEIVEKRDAKTWEWV